MLIWIVYFPRSTYKVIWLQIALNRGVLYWIKGIPSWYFVIIIVPVWNYHNLEKIWEKQKFLDSEKKIK